MRCSSCCSRLGLVWQAYSSCRVPPREKQEELFWGRWLEMRDILMIAFAVLMFLLLFGYIRGCDRLR
jgi:hypothetical protein